MKKYYLPLFLKVTKYFAEKERKIQYNDHKFTLVSVGISHFTERARWALDLCGVSYEEELHGPLFHLSTTLLNLSQLPRAKLNHTAHLQPRSEQEKKIQRRKELTAVPKLVLSNSESLSIVPHGSDGILQYLYENYNDKCGSLYPTELKSEIQDYERMLSQELAVSITEFIFIDLLLHRNPAIPKYFFSNYLQRQSIPAIEKFWYRWMGMSFVRPTMIQGNQIKAENFEAVKQRIESIFKQMDQLLTSSQTPYLLNTPSLTALDLTFAAYAFPLFFPSQLDQYYLSRKEIENLAQIDLIQLWEFSNYLLSTYRSAKYVLWMYDNHRHKSPRPSRIKQKL